MSEASTPITLFLWYISGTGAFALIVASLATTFWGQNGDSHFGVFEICDGDDCKTFDNINTIEGRLCIFASVIYGLELIIMTYFFMKLRDIEVGGKKWQSQAGVFAVGAFVTFVAVGVFASEMNALLSLYSFGVSFYLAIASGVVAICSSVFMYIAVDHYVKHNIQQSSNGQSLEQVVSAAQVVPPVATTGYAVNYGQPANPNYPGVVGYSNAPQQQQQPPMYGFANQAPPANKF